MKIPVVISLTLTLSHVVVFCGRVRRTVTDKEKSDILNHHNVLRARLGASDMEFMTWNESLAQAAAKLVAQCEWGHSYPPLPRTTFSEYGQNLYMKSGAKINVTEWIQHWYDEKPDNECDTPECAPRQTCAHYSQIVAAKSNQIGCAYHYCKTVKESAFTNAQYLACNYLPQLFEGEEPFNKGPPCSKCGNDAQWCKNGLCNNQCSKEVKGCTCEAICYNCAQLDLKACRCSCADGWSGPDCWDRCEDRHKNCNPTAGWPRKWCDHYEHGRKVRRNCPVMCEVCKPNPDAEANKCRPIYAIDEASKLASSTMPPTAYMSDVNDDDDDDDDDDDNGSQHQQQCITVALLSYVILSLTVTRTALL